MRFRPQWTVHGPSGDDADWPNRLRELNDWSLEGTRRDDPLCLACIDAPEMAQRPYGHKAREYLRLRLPIGGPVTLKVQTTDRYARTVAELFSDINVNLALVEDGQAFADRKYMRQCDAQEYLAAETRASRRRHGVWDVPGGTTPDGPASAAERSAHGRGPGHCCGRDHLQRWRWC